MYIKMRLPHPWVVTHYDEVHSTAALLLQLPMPVPAVSARPFSVFSSKKQNKKKSRDKQTQETTKKRQKQKDEGTNQKDEGKQKEHKDIKEGGKTPTRPPTTHACRTQRAHR